MCVRHGLTVIPFECMCSRSVNRYGRLDRWNRWNRQYQTWNDNIGTRLNRMNTNRVTKRIYVILKRHRNIVLFCRLNLQNLRLFKIMSINHLKFESYFDVWCAKLYIKLKKNFNACHLWKVNITSTCMSAPTEIDHYM